MTPETFAPDRATYVRAHWTMAALAMAAGMAILWAMGNPHIWTGLVGGLAAVALRGWYLMDEELGHLWVLEDGSLNGPQGRSVPLPEIETLRRLGATVQIVTRQGDKHLIKFQSDPANTCARIEAAKERHA